MLFLGSKNKTQIEEENNAESRVHFICEHKNSISFAELDVSAIVQLC